MTKYSAKALAVTIGNYEVNLGVNIESLKGKEILDIGAGYGMFQRDCDAKGISVISLEPQYKYSEELRKYLDDRKNKIAGINETLPFKNESFDMILSSNSSFSYLNYNYPKIKLKRRMAKKMFEEVLRVLRSNGEARIGWMVGDYKEFYNSLLEEISKNSKSKISWEFVYDSMLKRLVLHKH